MSKAPAGRRSGWWARPARQPQLVRARFAANVAPQEASDRPGNARGHAIPTVRYSPDAELGRPRAFLRAAATDLTNAVLPARLFVASAVRSRHRRAWLGYAWLLIPAVATAAACAALRAGNIVEVGATSLPYPLFALVGMLLWQGFVEGIAMPQQVIVAHRQLLTRTPIPHEAALLGGLFELTLNTVIRLCVMAVALIIFGVPVAASWLLVPPGAILLAALGVATGLLLAPLGLLYQDVARITGLVTGFGLLLTPVLYPAPPGSLLRLNPVVPLLDGTRGAISGAMPSAWFVIVGAAAIIGIVTGWLAYRIARPHLIERLG